MVSTSEFVGIEPAQGERIRKACFQFSERKQARTKFKAASKREKNGKLAFSFPSGSRLERSSRLRVSERIRKACFQFSERKQARTKFKAASKRENTESLLSVFRAEAGSNEVQIKSVADGQKIRADGK